MIGEIFTYRPTSKSLNMNIPELQLSLFENYAQLPPDCNVLLVQEYGHISLVLTPWGVRNVLTEYLRSCNYNCAEVMS